MDIVNCWFRFYEEDGTAIADKELDRRALAGSLSDFKQMCRTFIEDGIEFYGRCRLYHFNEVEGEESYLLEILKVGNMTYFDFKKGIRETKKYKLNI